MVTAVYNGESFVPTTSCKIKKGAVVRLAIIDEDLAEKSGVGLSEFLRLTQEICRLDKDEPLGTDFDEVLARRVNFSRKMDL
jgi:hypothetical protein